MVVALMHGLRCGEWACLSLQKDQYSGMAYPQGASALNFRSPSGVLTIDTYILSNTLETGLVGGIAFIVLFVIGSIKSAKVYTYSNDDDKFEKMAAALASTLIAFLVVKMVLSQHYNHTLLFLILGIVTHFRINRKKSNIE